MTTERFTRAKRIERRRDALREVHEELERFRRSEARVAEALGSMRASRQRVEEVVRAMIIEDETVRDIVRQEIDAADRRAPNAGNGDHPASDLAVAGVAASRGASEPREQGPDDDTPEDLGSGASEADVEETRRSFRTVAFAALGVLLVATIGWVAVQALRDDAEAPPLTLGGDSMAPVQGQAIAEANREAEQANGAEQAEEADRFFIQLPDEAAQRAAVYDSLWQARSPIFTPLFERIESATSESTVRRALEAFRAGTPTALQRDLLHSALVQYSLREEMGAELAVDGQLLRNPCRGASCSALLNFWETRGESAGLPPVPDDAPTNTSALKMAENILVLRTLEGLHGRPTNGG